MQNEDTTNQADGARPKPLKYISICSGIEAASLAFHPLGWEPLAFAEIEAFPSAVLTHHYPAIPNLGDMTKFRDWPEELLAECDILVGGPPCQAFSVAGLRNSLDDARGNLTLTYVNLIDHIDSIRRKHGREPIISIYENVPGIYSTRDNAFGCLVGAICGQDAPVETETGKWPTTGVFWGEKRRVGYRTLDAQYFGVAQRRRRCFLIAVPNQLVERLGERACPSEILSIPESLRGDTPPCRETGKGTPAAFETGPHGGNLADLAPTLDTRCKDGPIRNQLGIGVFASTGNKSHCLNAGGMSRQDATSETLIVHTLRAEGFDASEDGTGRGTPLVPIVDPLTLETLREMGCAHFGTSPLAFPERMSGTQCASAEDISPALGALNPTAVAIPLQEVSKRTGISTNDPRAGIGIGEAGDPMYTLQAGAQHGVAIPLDLRNAGRDPEKYDAVNRQGCGIGEAGEPSPTLSAAFMPGVAFAQNTRDEVRYVNGDGSIIGALGAETGMKQQSYIAQAMAVRRITVTEAERLMGMPDGYTEVPFRGKPAADGNRYKALGNSMAVPCMAWLGLRIHRAIQQ